MEDIRGDEGDDQIKHPNSYKFHDHLQIQRRDPHRHEHDLGTVLASATLGAPVRKPSACHDELAQDHEHLGVEDEDSTNGSTWR